VLAISTADNGVADTVYAGDLYGNLWKFDLTASVAASWKPAFGATGAWLPLFTTAAGQPITARPDVTRVARGGYMVTVGTGRYIDFADNNTGTTQTLYGVWDNGAPVAMADLQTQSIVSNVATGGKTYRLSTFAVGTPPDTAIAGDNVITLAQYNASKKGWKLNLPTPGERVVTDAAVRNGRLGVSTLIPSDAVCSFGGDGWLIELDAATGNRAAAFDTTANNVVNADDRVNGTMVSGVKVGSVPAAATVLRGTGAYRGIDYKLVTTSDGAPPLRQSVSGSTATSRRAAWEQLQ
jgi:type IV pilus assembly protein PilY1